MALNKIILTGRLGRNCEVKTSKTGNKVAVLNLAVDDGYRAKDGNYVKRTSWVRCISYSEKFVTSLEKYALKGRFIGVEGKLVSRTYQDKNDKKCSVLEVQLTKVEYLEKRPSINNEQTDILSDENLEDENLDDEIPF